MLIEIFGLEVTRNIVIRSSPFNRFKSYSIDRSQSNLRSSIITITKCLANLDCVFGRTNNSISILKNSIQILKGLNLGQEIRRLPALHILYAVKRIGTAQKIFCKY